MLDEAGEGCSEVDVDDLFVLDDGAFEMLDDGAFEMLDDGAFEMLGDGAFEMLDDVNLVVPVKDLVELEDTDLVVSGELFLVLVEVLVILKDDDFDEVIRMLVEIFFVLVKDFVELDGRLVVLVEILSMVVEDLLVLDDNDFVGFFLGIVVALFVLVKGLAVLVEDFLVLVRVFLVVAGVLCVVVEPDFPSTQLQSLSRSLAAYFRNGEEVRGLRKAQSAGWSNPDDKH